MLNELFHDLLALTEQNIRAYQFYVFAASIGAQGHLPMFALREATLIVLKKKIVSKTCDILSPFIQQN